MSDATLVHSLPTAQQCQLATLKKDTHDQTGMQLQCRARAQVCCFCSNAGHASNINSCRSLETQPRCSMLTAHCSSLESSTARPSFLNWSLLTFCPGLASWMTHHWAVQQQVFLGTWPVIAKNHCQSILCTVKHAGVL